jgi:hypothetical protein
MSNDNSYKNRVYMQVFHSNKWGSYVKFGGSGKSSELRLAAHRKSFPHESLGESWEEIIDCSYITIERAVADRFRSQKIHVEVVSNKKTVASRECYHIDVASAIRPFVVDWNEKLKANPTLAKWLLVTPPDEVVVDMVKEVYKVKPNARKFLIHGDRFNEFKYELKRVYGSDIKITSVSEHTFLYGTLVQGLATEWEDMDNDFDVIITNPPFSSGGYSQKGGTRDLWMDHVKALTSFIKPGGTLALISPFTPVNDFYNLEFVKMSQHPIEFTSASIQANWGVFTRKDGIKSKAIFPDNGLFFDLFVSDNTYSEGNKASEYYYSDRPRLAINRQTFKVETPSKMCGYYIMLYGTHEELKKAEDWINDNREMLLKWQCKGKVSRTRFRSLIGGKKLV